MELNLSCQEQNNVLKKYLFNLKSPQSDGLILRVHHSSNLCGEIKRHRFILASFNDLRMCLAAADDKGNLFIIDLGMEKYWGLPNVGLCTLISFPVSRKQELLISLNTGCILFYHIETGSINGMLNGHKVPASEVSYSDDGYYCLTSCSAEAIVWDLSSYTQIHRLSLKAEASLKKVVFMPVTNYILACFQDDTMHVWQFGTFECIKQIIPETWKTHHLRDIALTKNGKVMVIGGHTPNLVIFSLDTWVIKKVVEFPENISGIKQLEFVPQVFDGGANKILAILTTSLEIYFFDIETSTFLVAMHHIFGMTAKFVISGTGKYFASIFTTGEINIYAIEKIFSAREFSEENLSRIKLPKTESNATSRNLSNRSKTQKSIQSLSSIKQELQQVLNIKKLQPILKQFGEYPETYRILIWKTILQVPGNQDSFVSLSMKSCHSSYANLESKYPLVNKAMCNSLKKLLSNLSYWCPLFGEVNFLPEFVFPFVKLFHADPLGCFEVVATIIINWCQNWFEFYPFPPVNMLSVLENILGYHDPDLLEFYFKKNITSSISVCPLFHTAFSEVLSKSEWLKLWDHVLSNEPSFLFMAIVAYNAVCKNAIKSLKDAEEVEKFFHSQNPVDMKMLISKSYFYLKETPDEIHSRQFFSAFRPFSSGGSYASFLAYPKLIIDSSVKKLQAIRKEEEVILEEQMKALNIKQRLEKKLRSEDKTEGHERIYRELEEKIRKTVNEEENRILTQRQRLRNLRQELRLKELEVLESTRDKALKERQKRKELELERLLHDISKRRAIEKSEAEIIEEEIRQYYSELLLKKIQLELDLGITDSENEVGDGLELQREKLKKDLYELQNEWSSLQHNKSIDISDKMASCKKLINDLKIDVAKKMVKEQQSDDSHSQIQKLKTKVKTLESQTEKLLMENLSRIQKKQNERVIENRQQLEQKKFSSSNFNAKTSLTAALTRSNCNKKGGIAKPENEKFKGVVKTASKKIEPKARSRVKKLAIRSKQKHPQVQKNRQQETKSSRGCDKPTQKLNFQKPRSKLTCRSPYVGELETANVIGDAICVPHEYAENESSDNKAKLRRRNLNKETLNCGCVRMTGRKATNKTSQLFEDYSFGSDSENEIFKSALRTRKQLIEEAKRRHQL